MESFVHFMNDFGQDWLQFMLSSSLQLSILILAILAISAILRTSAAAWYHLLWFLVLLKAAIPPFAVFSISGGETMVASLPMPVSLPFNPGREVLDPTLSYAAWLLLIWTVSVVILLTLYIQRNLAFRAQLKTSEQLDLKKLPGPVRELIGNHRVYVTDQFSAPFAWNPFRPAIYLPSNWTTWTLAEVKATLLHELSHIKRQDLWMIIFQQAVLTIYFFNPLVWIANWRMSIHREQACDDYVIANSGQNAVDYGNMLLARLDQSIKASKMSFMVNYFHQNKSTLSRRLNYLLNRKEGVMRAFKTREILIAGMVGCFVLASSLVSCEKSKIVQESGADRNVTGLAGKAPPSPIGGPQAIQANLHYPEAARKAGIQGTVIVRCLLDSTGNITETKIIKSIGDQACDVAAVAALTAVKWNPAMQEGKPVNTWLSIPVIFKLKKQAAGMGKIVGIVSNSDGAPVKGVVIRLPGPLGSILMTQSDESGRFVILNVPPGKHNLEFGMPPEIDYQGMMKELDEAAATISDRDKLKDAMARVRAKYHVDEGLVNVNTLEVVSMADEETKVGLMLENDE